MNDASPALTATAVTVQVPPGTPSGRAMDYWVEEARRHDVPALRDGAPGAIPYYGDELFCGLVTVGNDYLVLAIRIADAMARPTTNRTVYARPMGDDEARYFACVPHSTRLHLTFNSPLTDWEFITLGLGIDDWFDNLRCPDGYRPNYEVRASGQLILDFSEALLSRESMMTRLGNLLDSVLTGQPRPLRRYLVFAGWRLLSSRLTTPRRITYTTQVE